MYAPNQDPDPNIGVKDRRTIVKFIQLEGIWKNEHQYIYWNDPIVAEVFPLMIGRSFILEPFNATSLVETVLSMADTLLLEKTL